MLFLEKLEVESARRNMQRFEQFLRTDADATRVKQIASNVMHSVDPNGITTRELLALPQATFQTQVNNAPTPRNADLDERIERLIAYFYKACDDIEEWQQKQRENASLPRAELRERVLRFAAERSHNSQQINDIQSELCLSQDQVMDAIEHLSGRGAIKVENEYSTGAGDISLAFRVTSRGRDLADGSAPTFPSAPSTPRQTFHISQSQFVMGDNHGSMHQSIRNDVPAIPSDVHAALDAHPAGSALMASFEEETAKATPEPSKVKKLLEGLKFTVESANLATEVGQHFGEWFDAVSSLFTG